MNWWNNIRQIVADTLQWLGTLPDQLFTIGHQLMQGLVNGITSALGLVKSTINDVSDNVVSWFKNKLGIHSPSQVFAALGDYTMQGFAIGLQRSEQNPVAQMSNLAKRLTQLGAGIMMGTSTMPSLAMDQRSPITQSASGSTVIHGDTIHITIQAQPNMNEQAIARAISNALENRDRQKAARLRSSYATY